MKLRNKKTGEIFDYTPTLQRWNGPLVDRCNYNSLAELNEEWEDYEEPKESFWTIGKDGTPIEYNFDFDGKFYEECDNKWVDKIKEMGFYFETEEETEKAVEKLKAWKRLKDKGFRFDGWKCTGSISFTFDNYCGDGQPMSASDDLDLLFSGEDD